LDASGSTAIDVSSSNPPAVRSVRSWWKRRYARVEIGEQYGSRMTTRPPGASTRDASSRKRAGRARWWNTSTSTRFATDPAENGMTSASTISDVQGVGSTSVGSILGHTAGRAPIPAPSSIDRPGAEESDLQTSRNQSV